MNIYVGNMPYTVTEDELRTLFAEHGKVDSVTIITDKFSGQPKGFGFVEMPVNSEADKAIKAINGMSIKGRAINVNEAKPRADRPSRGKKRY